MKRLAILVGLASLTCGCTQKATLKRDPDQYPLASPSITDCASDFRERGRPTEKPVDPTQLGDLRAALDADLRASSNGFELSRLPEPLCFYVVPDEQLMIRDADGLEYYLHKVPKWDLEKVAITKQPN